MRIMKLLTAFTFVMISNGIQAQECISLSQNDVLSKNNVIVINSSGNYCIADDIKLTERSYLNHGWRLSYDSPLVIATHAPDIQVDLSRRTLVATSTQAMRPGGIGIRKPNVLIKNGTLRVIGKQGVGVIHKPSGSSYITIPTDKKYLDYETTREVDHPEGEDRTYLFGSQKLPPKYQDANITIDNMNIFATYRGVQLADNHNTIRNSTIEVDDNTAIYLMGQYPVIENNTNIIHSNKNGDTETQKKYNIQIKDGAIKLRDAKGGIIRNNRIIYKGGLFGGKAPVAINLLDSKDVIIEGNSIEGFESLVRENGDTSYSENNNTKK